MHIPVGETTKQSILTFQEALDKHKPDKPYSRERWLYVPDFYSEYRYILGTKGKHPLITLGINPSTAEPDNLDNTLKSVERIALHNGFDSFLMFNVYAQRATRPDDMDLVFNEELHHQNLLAFRYCLEQSEGAPTLWAAWGAIAEKRDYLMTCIRDMAALGNEYGAQWVKAGTVSKKGHPHHPLYLKKDSPLEPFDIKAYLKER
ncbi:MAG: DUF1643 domain-containing protein [Oscillospiraceae bacterium]|nr:DUF1643 domain-containing protein [Oscillospiraceae bacterium]